MVLNGLPSEFAFYTHPCVCMATVLHVLIAHVGACIHCHSEEVRSQQSQQEHLPCSWAATRMSTKVSPGILQRVQLP